MSAAMCTRRTLQLAIVAAFTIAMSGGCDRAEGTTEPAPTASPPAEQVPKTTLRLELIEKTPSWVIVDLVYNPEEGAEGPRAMELWLRHSSQLAFVSAEGLAAAVEAGKTTIVQPKEGGELRTILFSQSLAQVGAGRLVRYHFEVAGEGAATVEILARMPIFAPVSANQGVLLPDKLVIGGMR